VFKDSIIVVQNTYTYTVTQKQKNGKTHSFMYFFLVIVYNELIEKY